MQNEFRLTSAPFNYQMIIVFLLYAKLSAAQMGKDGVAPPEPEGNRFTVCPATIYGIFPHVRFPLRLSHRKSLLRILGLELLQQVFSGHCHSL